MKDVSLVLIWVVLTSVWTSSRGDVEVFCVFHQSCILPCSFHNASETVIHWAHLAAGESVVHSYDGKDQLGHQDQNFRGRTSLFQDQISRGNASLLLRGVQVQDGGRYRCSPSITDADMSFVTVTVEAPVSEVNITEVDNMITCSSEGIYPEPELTWSTIPPSNIILKSTTMVRLAEQQLYSISSSLTVSDGASDLVYICSIRTSRSSMEAATQEKTKTGRSIGLIVLVVLLAALMGVLPCLFEKFNKRCKDVKSHLFPRQHQRDAPPHLRASCHTDQQDEEIRTPRGKDEGDACLGDKITSQQETMSV